ncbi:hypothetical protein [Cytobacillus praedii]|uniref:hypothetical protein n=1 Tax=Cytobacillus praedii TaxID=1742358 RepID=UPI002E1DCC45|nr:hypothetical protein [Cytobacillus praedii]
MRIKSFLITIVLFLFIVLSGCSSVTEEESNDEIDKEIYSQETVESMFSEENLEAAKERLEERGGSDFIIPEHYYRTQENESPVIELTNADILDGEDASFEIYNNLGDIRLDSLELESTFEGQDEYTGYIDVEQIGIAPNYYADYYSILQTAAIPEDNFQDLNDNIINFYLERYSSFVECQFRVADSGVKERIMKNVEYSKKNELPIIVFGKYEQYIDDDGGYSHRLVIHKIGFKEIID